MRVYCMHIFKNIVNYKKHYQDYLFFEKKQDEKESKRLAYLKKHPELLNKDEIERNKLIFEKLNLLDKYTTNNSEDAEVATEIIKDQAVSISTIAVTTLAYLAGKTKPIQEKIKNITAKHPNLEKPIQYLPATLGLLGSLAISIPVINWNTNKEIQATTQGRINAMQSLKSPNHYAILTQEQKEEINKIAPTISINKKTKKELNLGIISNIKDLEEKEDELENTIQTHRERALQKKNNAKTQQEIAQAKKDEKIIIQLIQKMDKETEKSAKNIGILGNIAHLAVIGAGLFTRWASNYLINNLSFIKNSQAKKIIPLVTGGLTTVYTSLWASKVGKKSAKIARNKIKESMLKSPENFVYIEESLYQNEAITSPSTPPKTSLKESIQDYKTFNKKKKQLKKELIQKKLATEKITITEKQKNDAINLKKTIFKTYSKIDKKEQCFKESVEALGEIIMLPLELASMAIASMILNSTKLQTKTKIPLSLATALIPNLLAEHILTQEQDKAGQVGNMLAIQALERKENKTLVQKNEKNKQFQHNE